MSMPALSRASCSKIDTMLRILDGLSRLPFCIRIVEVPLAFLTHNGAIAAHVIDNAVRSLHAVRRVFSLSDMAHPF